MLAGDDQLLVMICRLGKDFCGRFAGAVSQKPLLSGCRHHQLDRFLARFCRSATIRRPRKEGGYCISSILHVCRETEGLEFVTSCGIWFPETNSIRRVIPVCQPSFRNILFEDLRFNHRVVKNMNFFMSTEELNMYHHRSNLLVNRCQNISGFTCLFVCNSYH